MQGTSGFFTVLRSMLGLQARGCRKPKAGGARHAAGVECLEKRDLPSATGFSGQIAVIPAPRSVEVHKLESNAAARFFQEQQRVTLGTNLTVDAAAPGTYSQPSSLKPANILAGTMINSFYLHADRVGQPAAFVQFRGSITFAEPVLGVVVTDVGLNRSDSLGSATTTYPKIGRSMDAADVANPDSFSLSADRKTITFDLRTAGNSDDIRIVTAATPLTGVETGKVFLRAPWAATGNRTLAIGAPQTVEANKLEDANYALFFAEKAGVVLPAALGVDASIAGEYNMKTAMRQAVIPAGTRVNSYYLHLDRVGAPAGNYDEVSGSVTFDTPILGVIGSEAKLVRSDFLGANGTFYPTSRRAVDRTAPYNLDRFWISADMKTLRYQMQTSVACDAIRIITAATTASPAR